MAHSQLSQQSSRHFTYFRGQRFFPRQYFGVERNLLSTELGLDGVSQQNWQSIWWGHSSSQG
jgi:hypothetical protein